jgi:hypothetical protein
MWLNNLHISLHAPLNHCSLARWRIGTLALFFGLTLVLDAKAIDNDLPNLCTFEPPDANKLGPDNVHEPQNCYEFGGAVGELGLGWRKKLPKHVQLLNRKDAVQLCKQSATQFGQKVNSDVPGGCVFLKTDECTIVSDVHIASASIGNAVRSCVP